MAEIQRYVDHEGGFAVQIPEGWLAELDREEEGVELREPEGVGVLHLLGFPQPADEVPDPAEELYAFLEDQEIELKEDEVEDLSLGDRAEMAICEYVAEEEGEDEEPTYWLLGVATAPGVLVFASYSCPAGEEERERDAVRAILRSIQPLEAPDSRDQSL